MTPQTIILSVLHKLSIRWISIRFWADIRHTDGDYPVNNRYPPNIRQKSEYERILPIIGYMPNKQQMANWFCLLGFEILARREFELRCSLKFTYILNIITYFIRKNFSGTDEHSNITLCSTKILKKKMIIVFPKIVILLSSQN